MNGRSFPREVQDLKRRYEAAGKDFERLWRLVVPLAVPALAKSSHREWAIGLMERLMCEPPPDDLPGEVARDYKAFLGRVAAWVRYPEPPPRLDDRRRLGRPRAEATVAWHVNLIVATVAEEFRRVFGRPRWDDVLTLLQWAAPHVFPPSTNVAHLRERARRVLRVEVEASQRCFFG